MKRTGFKIKSYEDRIKAVQEASNKRIRDFLDKPPKKAKKGRISRNLGGIWDMKTADMEFSIWVRQRDPFCYFGCGRKSIQNSHFWGRGNSATRYDPLNCDGVCGHCHLIHEGNKQGLYRDLKLKQLGVKIYDEMERRARSTYSRSHSIEECRIFLSTPSTDFIYIQEGV